MTNILKKSLDNKQPIEIMYISKSENITKRIITVLELNETYIKAICHVRKSTRTFRITNILAAMPLKNHNKAV